MNARTTKRLLATGLLAGAAFLPGCATSVNSVERSVPESTREIVSDRRVEPDASLRRKVRIVAVNTAEAPGNYLKVQVEVVNTTGSLQRFNYKFEWFDSAGIIINTPSSIFIPQQIEGKESVMLAGVAPTAAAKDFRLKLIESSAR